MASGLEFRGMKLGKWIEGTEYPHFCGHGGKNCRTGIARVLYAKVWIFPDYAKDNCG